MKKLMATLLALCILMVAAPVLANLDDTRETIAQKYGEFGIIIDTDNQLWTKEQWEKSGYKKAQADTYVYRIRRGEIGMQMDVKYDGSKPTSFVRIQRFTPDIPFQIKDFQALFPEIYPILVTPQSVAFASYKDVSKNLLEKNSPVTMGVAVKKEPTSDRKSYYTLVAFNVQDEGRFVKDPKFIDENTFIREFVIELTYAATIKDNLGGDWKEIKNYFNPQAVAPPVTKPKNK